MQTMAHRKKGQAMQGTVTESPYMDYESAARYCSVHRTTLWRAVRDGALRASGPGMAVRFHRDELDRWMDARNRK